MSEFDPTNSGWRKLLKNGGVGYTENAKVLTCDGDTKGKNMYGYEYRVSGEVLDLSTFTKIHMIVDGEEMTLTKEQWTAAGGYVTADGIGGERDGNIVSTHQEPWGDNYPVGTYVVCVGSFYVSRIEFFETVHPIDPKYLGNAMPNVVDLNEFEVVDDVLDLNGVLVTAMSRSIENGTAQSLEIQLPDSAFRDACSVNRQLVIKMQVGDDIFLPVSFDTYAGRINQISAFTMMRLANVGIIDSKILIEFDGDTTLNVYIKSVVLT